MWPCGAVVAGSREMEGDKAWLRSQCRAGPAWPRGHKLQPNWRVPWRPHCYWAEDRGGDWRGGPFPSLSLSSPEAPSAGTILVLAKDCGERCLTVSIYARHLQDINNLFPCCSAHCFHWCILWLWNWCLKLHCLNQLFTSSLLEHQFYFTLHICLLPFFYLATFHQFLALLPPSLPLNILTALWTFLQHVCWSVWHANLSAVWLVTLVFNLLNTWTCLVLTLGSLYVSLHTL